MFAREEAVPKSSSRVPMRSFPGKSFLISDLSFVELGAIKENKKKNLSCLYAAEVCQEVNMSAWGLGLLVKL